tara:strand:- start:8557 stop:9021 length:465 start_codon:yes stop_codon:yes gene_type:complete
MLIKILPSNNIVKNLYEGHTHFHQGDAGLDLFILEDIIVPAKSISFKINTGISCEAFTIKEGTENNCSFYLYPRSSMGANTPLRLCNSVGIIDAEYRGEIIAMVDNISDQDYHITNGSRLFQLCSPTLESISVEVVNTLGQTSRGSLGLGSTGV